MTDQEPSKVPCKDCGASILPATAERTGGKCMPCHTGRDPKADRGLGVAPENRVDNLKTGLFVAAIGVVIYLFFLWFETSSLDHIQVPWYVAVAYKLGGKYVIAGFFVVLGTMLALRPIKAHSEES